MDQLDRIREMLDPILKENDLVLYSLKWTMERKDRVLQVMIMKQDGTMDLDTCELVSRGLSDALDEADLIADNYNLEVCSPGAEREILSLDELRTCVGKHVYMRLKHAVKSMVEITGDIESYEGQEITIAYRDKAATRKVSFKEEEIEFMRYAVRI